MLEVFAKIIMINFTTNGFTEVIKFIIFKILLKNTVGTLYLVISIEGHDESVEMKIESAIERLRWSPGENKKLICIDKGMDEETAMVCRILSHQNPGIEIYTPEEFNEVLNL